MLLNLLKFNWALKSNTSVVFMILCKVVFFNFLGGMLFMEIWQDFRILFPCVRAMLCYLLILMLTIRMLPLLRLTGRFIQLWLFKCSCVTFLFDRWNNKMCVYTRISFLGISNISFLFQKHAKNKVEQNCYWLILQKTE